jgi:uncharacterized protein (TIGR03382 family)
MKTWMRAGLSVALACLMGAASVASACPIAGKVVCDTNSSLGVSGVTVLVTRLFGQVGPYTFTTSDAVGHVGEYSGYLEMTGTYELEVGSTKVTVRCEPGAAVYVPDIAVTDPSCGGGADCSPGFYKNHETAWCPAGSEAAASGIVCQDEATYTCDQLVCLLSAEPPCKSKEPERAFAKACLDAFSPANICSESETRVGAGVTKASVTAESPAATGGCSSTGGSVGWSGLVGLGLLAAMHRRRSGRAPRE